MLDESRTAPGNGMTSANPFFLRAVLMRNLCHTLANTAGSWAGDRNVFRGLSRVVAGLEEASEEEMR